MLFSQFIAKRVVTVDKDGKMVEHTVYECDIWQEERSHLPQVNACLDEIISFYQKKFVAVKIYLQIEGTHKLRSVAGDPLSRNVPVSVDGTASHKLTVSAMPCTCLGCRKNITAIKCQYKHIRKEQILEVSEEVKGAKRNLPSRICDRRVVNAICRTPERSSR
jgi:hypothetical protein